MNWANRLTLGRLALTILFVLALSSVWSYGRSVALVLFALAGISDYFDGEIARRYGIVTKFGKLMDPLVDKVMMAAAFICLVPLGAVPAWVATIVVARDFLITGLRLLASSEGMILPAEKLGKHKTSWQIVTVVFFLLLFSARELRPGIEESGWWQIAWRDGGNLLLWITIGLTILSGLGYLWRHRALVRDPARRAAL
jgi:CDP-diacylglycerol---glycerol-3-phosphate 3-phosphatidyltransferase